MVLKYGCCYAQHNILEPSKNRGGVFALELVEKVKEVEVGKGGS